MVHLHQIFLAGLLGLMLSAPTLAAQSAPVQPAWMTDAVIRDLVALELTASQRALLQAELGNTLRAIQADVHKITKRGGFGLEKKIKRANKFHWRAFDAAMRPTLSEQQEPLFERYLRSQIQAVAINLAGKEPLHSIRSN
ncbi:MAG: hypothetical protein P8N63_08125 [Pseudomonadales bacterium]|nr:hypothetical protein [Pseudomonadales bacterium]